jgi:hypothetical protein
MIRLGLRLAVANGKEAITRLALIAIGVAVGVGLLLATLASLNAFNAQNERYAWLNTGTPGAEQPVDAASPDEPVAVDPLWWLLRGDYFQGELIGRVDLAATGPDFPDPARHRGVARAWRVLRLTRARQAVGRHSRCSTR